MKHNIVLFSNYCYSNVAGLKKIKSVYPNSVSLEYIVGMYGAIC